MTHDLHVVVRSLYKKLLTLYPRVFRERLGVSMEQTFRDLYREKQQMKKGLFSFVLWIFIETFIGIFREHVSILKEGTAMKNILTNLRSPALISSVLVLPFMILEVLNRRQFNEGFPIALFVVMWLLPMGFILVLMPVVRKVRAGNKLMATPVPLLLSITLLILIAIVWTGTLIDQLPCFLGVPNCD